MGSFGQNFVDAIAEVARRLGAEGTADEALRKIVELAPGTIGDCHHAAVSMVDGGVETRAASDDVPCQVDRIQYESGEGPCLDAIRTAESCRATICAAMTAGRASAPAR
jgi:hypothetical protein